MKSQIERLDYVYKWMSLLHSIFISVVAFIGTFYLCDDPSASIFTSNQCLIHTKKLQEAACLIAGSFLAYDTIYMAIFLNSLTPISTYVHHLLIVPVYICAVISGLSVPITVCCSNLFLESTTILLNIR